MYKVKREKVENKKKQKNCSQTVLHTQAQKINLGAGC
jgi:hypothetical protein